MRPHTLHPGAIQGKEGIKFCHLATLVKVAGFTSFGILGVCSNFACQSYNRYNSTTASTEQWISEDGRIMSIQPRLHLQRIGRNYR